MIGNGISLKFRSGEALLPYIDDLAFWGDAFDYDISVLKDKSGNANHVPLVNGNCVNFINDVTITLYPAKVGATITELNKSTSDLNGIAVNGSGHVEITQASLTDPKVYQFKLSTGDEYFLIGGATNYALCSGSVWGLLGGTENTDWEWETQDNYFGNLQNGYNTGGGLPYDITNDLTDAGWGYRDGWAVAGAAEAVYTGGQYAYTSLLDFRNAGFVAGKTYSVKITVWDSTENFPTSRGSGGFYQHYMTNNPTYGNDLEYDDNGVLLSLNGEHIITGPWDTGVDRISFDFLDVTNDNTGRNLKLKVDWVKQVEDDILIMGEDYDYTLLGDALINKPANNRHNGCEVQLDFSGISGVTEAGGGAWTGPSAYTPGDAVTNPMFKRVRYNTDLEEEESEFAVFDSFVTGSVLTRVLEIYEEANMLMKYFPDDEAEPILVIQKYDATRDVVTVFCKVGYNGLYTYSGQHLVNNSNQLPVGIELADLSPSYNQYTDRVGPYNLADLSWCGGAHVAPSSDDTGEGDWAEVTAVDNGADTVALDSVADFPSQLEDTPPFRLVEIRNGTGTAYTTVLTRSKYTINGNVLTLTPVNGGTGADLSAVVTGGANPSRANYNYQTAGQASKSISSGYETWTPIKRFSLDVVNHLYDYREINKSTLKPGSIIIKETVHYKISQKAPFVFINYTGEFKQAWSVNTYYGIQGGQIAAATDARMYLPHSDDETLRAITGVLSGDRSTYPCEKVIMIDDVTDNDASKNIVSYIDLNFGSVDEGLSTLDYWNTELKNYFRCVNTQNIAKGYSVTWRGGYGLFKNVASTQYIIAYFQWENEDLYFIVDFTDSLTFGSINEVFTAVSGRKVEQVYKDSGISIASTPGTEFTVPDTGLDLTATAAGNIKLKLV